jgi:hypothetical protein
MLAVTENLSLIGILTSYSHKMSESGEYRKYKRGSYPFSNPDPGEECAGATGRAAEMQATYLQSPRTPLLAAAALPARVAIDPADPLPGHRAHGIRVNAVDTVAVRAAL